MNAVQTNIKVGTQGTQIVTRQTNTQVGNTQDTHCQNTNKHTGWGHMAYETYIVKTQSNTQGGDTWDTYCQKTIKHTGWGHTGCTLSKDELTHKVGTLGMHIVN